jgi:transcription termination/antitermination protein NusA
MKFISLFESLTRAKVKDCIEGNTLIFVVNHGEIAKAIGKKASNIHKIENVLKRKIKVVEFNDDITIFIKNLIAPIKVEDIQEQEGLVTITDQDKKKKGMIIGRDAINLRNYENIVSRYFTIKEIKVV